MVIYVDRALEVLQLAVVSETSNYLSVHIKSSRNHLK